jgi:hypothetical protein
VQRIADLLTKGKALWINHDNAQRWWQTITNSPWPAIQRERDGHIDLTHTAFLAGGDLLDVSSRA